ncbi:MAG: dTDP-4-dehydrorhamnose reductase [Actinomycetota bacterium]
MKLMVTGANGQLGRELVELCAARGDEVLGLDVESLDTPNRDAVHAAVAELAPDVVVNCAAYTAVDACEANEDVALDVNAHAVRWIAEAVDAVGAHLVHISTDYVFDGTLDRPYVESDPPNPRSAYGRTKLAGEREALALGSAGTVVRTSWVCGFHGTNMVKTVLRLVGENSPLSFVDDQVGHPTFTSDLAPALLLLARDRRAGLFHVTNQGAVSWYGFVGAIFDVLGRDATEVRPIATADLDPPRPAPRPANSVLENRAWRDAGYPPLRDFREPLGELVARLTARH